MKEVMCVFKKEGANENNNKKTAPLTTEGKI